MTIDEEEANTEMRMIFPPPSIGEATVIYTYGGGTVSIPDRGAPSNLDVNDGIANGTIKSTGKFISIEEVISDIEEALKTL